MSPLIPPTHPLLLVEDSEDDEMLSLRAVKNCGVPCNVVVVRTGTEAIGELLSPTGPSPELIILDFHLPNLNGLEILRELRKTEKFRFVPIVMLSSLESDDEFLDCLAEGANSCVQKPVDPSSYVESVSILVRYWLTVHRTPGQSPQRRQTLYRSSTPASDEPTVQIIKDTTLANLLTNAIPDTHPNL